MQYYYCCLQNLRISGSIPGWHTPSISPAKGPSRLSARALSVADVVGLLLRLRIAAWVEEKSILGHPTYVVSVSLRLGIWDGWICSFVRGCRMQAAGGARGQGGISARHTRDPLEAWKLQEVGVPACSSRSAQDNTRQSALRSRRRHGQGFAATRWVRGEVMFSLRGLKLVLRCRLGCLQTLLLCSDPERRTPPDLLTIHSASLNVLHCC